MKVTCNIKISLMSPDTWEEMQRLIDETEKAIDTNYTIDANYDGSPNISELKIDFVADSLEKAKETVKKIREACDGNHELHVRIFNFQ